MSRPPALVAARRLTPRLAAWLLLAATAAVGAVVWPLGPVPPAWAPPCPFHVLTGLHCPGCGSTRTLHALAHGEFGRALQLNPLLVLALPFLVAWAGAAWWRGVRHDLPPAPLPKPAAAVTLVTVLRYFVLRNLPWWPFTLLAPHSN